MNSSISMKSLHFLLIIHQKRQDAEAQKHKAT